MRSTVSLYQAAVAGVFLVGLVVSSGCSWFAKTDELYSQQTRPLEVPPDLDLPRTAAAVDMPVGSATASGTVAAANSTAGTNPVAAATPVRGAAAGAGFIVPGSRDEVFAKVGAALDGVEGVSVASRAKVLGAFDVNYRDSNFLIRVSETEAGASVSAVDPRGMPASGEAPVALVTALKAALGGG